MSNELTRNERCRAAFAGLSDFCRVDPQLHAQYERAQAEFGAASEAKLTGARALRYFEWFALERPVDGHAAPPVGAFVALGCPGLAEEFRPWAHALLEARVEVARVLEQEVHGLEVQLASDESRVRVHWPADPLRPGLGDTLLGFLLRVPGEEQYLWTDAVATLPGSSVFELFAGEAEEQRLAGRIEDELRPGMRELDRFLVLQGEREPAPRAALEAQLDEFLDPLDVRAADVGATLAQSREPGAVFGLLLDRLAFETETDLDTVRPLLLEYWARIRVDLEEAERASSGAESPSGAPDLADLDGAAVLAEIEAAESRGERLLDVLQRIEDELGVRRDASPDAESMVPDEIDWATEDVGSLAGLVQEYVWEREREAESSGALEAPLLEDFVARLSQSGVREPEGVDAVHVALYLLGHWQSGGFAAAMRALAQLGRFESWLEDEQELSFTREAAALRVELAENQARVLGLEPRIAGGEETTEAPMAWHVTERADDGRWQLEHGRRTVLLDAELDLAPGDLVLGSPTADAAAFGAGARILPAALARFLSPEEDEGDA